jgi:hypothetical protein
MPSGVISLGEVAARTGTIEVACRKCDRHGRLRTRRLLTIHGPAMGMPALLRILADGCPRLDNSNIVDGCGVHCADLPRLFLAAAPAG